jgi:flavin reductase (DIM6/NTAB) family NADH-FMN oxidoreductase RutF
LAKVDVGTEFVSGLLAPHSTVLVTAVDAKGKPNIITLGWTMPTSRDPPLVAISVGTRRYSHDLIEGSKEFVINVPPEELVEKAHFCGTRSGRMVDKFAGAGLMSLSSKRVKPPRIKECVAHLECKLVQKLRTGDHTIFVGEVVAASADEEVFDGKKGFINLKTFKPLLHLGGCFYLVAGKMKSI